MVEGRREAPYRINPIIAKVTCHEERNLYQVVIRDTLCTLGLMTLLTKVCFLFIDRYFVKRINEIITKAHLVLFCHKDKLDYYKSDIFRYGLLHLLRACFFLLLLL